jgi:hypothetical protein
MWMLGMEATSRPIGSERRAATEGDRIGLGWMDGAWMAGDAMVSVLWIGMGKWMDLAMSI